MNNVPNKHRAERVAGLLPDGKPKWIRVYDHGDDWVGRYTVIYSGNYSKPEGQHWWGKMSADPHGDNGICDSGSQLGPLDIQLGRWAGVSIGRTHSGLGKRIIFEDLPAACQQVVLSDYAYLWNLPDPKWDETLARVAAAEFNEECNLGMHNG